MDAKERRAAILQLLRNRTTPVTGGELSHLLGVSRQIIVQDVALLRSGGNAIFATPEGYVLPAATAKALSRRVVASCHGSNDDMRKELEIVVERGGTVVDVSIEHAVYGEISAPLMLRSKMGLDVFMAHFENEEGAEPISKLTSGVHLHTIEAPSEAVMQDILSALRDAGFLVE